MKKNKNKQDDTDELDIEVIQKPKLKEEIKKDHYIDNKAFYTQMVEWKQLCKDAEESDESRPPITNYIGECFMNIAEHLSRKANFMNYPYREEMVSDGIENCVMYAHNFDPEKSKNPFSYFTQIIYYAFLRRIEKEKKQAYIKLKMTELMDDGSVHRWFKENYFEKDSVQEAITEHFQITENDIVKFEPKKKSKKRKK
jgi:hypothetical protein